MKKWQLEILEKQKGEELYHPFTDKQRDMRIVHFSLDEIHVDHDNKHYNMSLEHDEWNFELNDNRDDINVAYHGDIFTTEGEDDRPCNPMQLEAMVVEWAEDNIDKALGFDRWATFDELIENQTDPRDEYNKEDY